MPHRNALNLDSNHNTAIRAEIGERLRVLLSKEQPRPPPSVQHLLDCLTTSDAGPVPLTAAVAARVEAFNTGGDPRTRSVSYGHPS